MSRIVEREYEVAGKLSVNHLIRLTRYIQNNRSPSAGHERDRPPRCFTGRLTRKRDGDFARLRAIKVSANQRPGPGESLPRQQRGQLYFGVRRPVGNQQAGSAGVGMNRINRRRGVCLDKHAVGARFKIQQITKNVVPKLRLFAPKLHTNRLATVWHISPRI